MAAYHFSVKVISRAGGRSAVAAAAYRAAEALPDDRLGRTQDFSRKTGVVHSEILLPESAPERLADRATLWNAVEAGEKRKDAQLAREVEFSLPRELDQAEGIRLARDFVREQFVARGMVADLNVHWVQGTTGPRIRIGQRGIENDKCNASSRHGMRKAFCRRTRLFYGHFRPRRHRMTATNYRTSRATAFRVWREETCARTAA